MTRQTAERIQAYGKEIEVPVTLYEEGVDNVFVAYRDFKHNNEAQAWLDLYRIEQAELGTQRPTYTEFKVA